MRLPSITDQIFIKAQRIRSIQEKGKQKVNEDISGEFVAIINYCIMAVIQTRLSESEGLEIDYGTLEPLYDEIASSTLELLQTELISMVPYSITKLRLQD